MGSTASPRDRSGFSTVRGRGYRPEQVHQRMAALSGERDSAWERAARLTVLANEMEAELTSLREYAQAMPPPTYQELGPRAGGLLGLVEEEARELTEQAAESAQQLRSRAEREAREWYEESRRAAAELCDAADDYARQALDAADRQAAELRGQAADEAARARAEAEQEWEAVRQRITETLAELDAAHRRQEEAFEREAAAREADVERRLAELLDRAHARLAHAEQEHGRAQEFSRDLNGQAEARAVALLADAQAAAERIAHEAQRGLQENEKARRQMREHLSRIRASLAELTAAPSVADEELDLRLLNEPGPQQEAEEPQRAEDVQRPEG